MERAFIYGDSLLKATVPDEEMHYHFHLPEVMAQYPSDRLEVVNRAKMGATVTKGLSLVKHDVQRGMDARWALVAYGGNDSDFDWPAIADAPDQEHLPRTALPEFVEKLRCAARMLRDAGVQPVLMTLPPIDSRRYYDWVTRSLDKKENVLKWLGDVEAIYRTHKSYSDLIRQVAQTLNVRLIDIRGAFERAGDLVQKLCVDGIHPNAQGHEIICGALTDYAQEIHAF